MSWDRECRRKGKALYFSTVNNTFSLWGEQGTLHFYFSPGPTNYVLSLVCTAWIWIHMCHIWVLEKWVSFYHTPFILIFHERKLYAISYLNHQRSVFKNSIKIMIRSKEITAERKQVPKWINIFNKQKQYVYYYSSLFSLVGKHSPWFIALDHSQHNEIKQEWYVRLKNPNQILWTQFTTAALST